MLEGADGELELLFVASVDKFNAIENPGNWILELSGAVDKPENKPEDEGGVFLNEPATVAVDIPNAKGSEDWDLEPSPSPVPCPPNTKQ